jgi:hypothetical protein
VLVQPRRDGSTLSEEFAWESREYLRKLSIGRVRRPPVPAWLHQTRLWQFVAVAPSKEAMVETRGLHFTFRCTSLLFVGSHPQQTVLTSW